MPNHKERKENYRHGRKWIEIIKTVKEEELTPTERMRREIEESLRVEREITTGLLKTEDADKVLPKLNELLLDELDAIAKYSELLILLRRISNATGMLEEETKIISKILEDEMRHESGIRSIISKLR